MEQQSDRLPKEFYNQNAYQLAESILGKLIVRNLNGTMIKCKIVESEVYPGGNDKASHSYNNRRTPRNEPMYMEAGTTYVYFTYGMYFCMNISSAEPGGAVLIRAGEPIVGIEKMRLLRKCKQKSKKPIKNEHLCNGPAKLCIAMDIDKNCNALHLATSNQIWLEASPPNINTNEIVRTKRIGIDKTGAEAVNQLFRFYILGNHNVSKRDKIQESAV